MCWRSSRGQTETAGFSQELERAKGIEPSTYSLGSCRSTTELRPRLTKDNEAPVPPSRHSAARSSGDYHGQSGNQSRPNCLRSSVLARWRVLRLPDGKFFPARLI
jgi:hypothetical protein